MKRHIITAVLITAMIFTMAACGNKTDATTAEEASTMETETTIEVSAQNTKDQAVALPMTDEEKVMADAIPSPDAKTTDAPNTTTQPKTSAKPVVTSTAKPNATETPKSTAAPKSTVAPTAAPETTATPVVTAAPEAAATPVPTATPAETPVPAAMVTCQHTSTHVESSHDSYEIPISGGCCEVWCYATRVCNNCGYNFGEAPDHVNDIHAGYHVITPGRTRTCTEAGAKETATCDCGFMFWETGDDGPAFGHDYVSIFDYSEETPNDDGISVTTKFYYVDVCRNCGDTSAPYEK